MDKRNFFMVWVRDYLGASLFSSGLGMLLIILAYLVAVFFPLHVRAAQNQSNLEWVTQPVSAPHLAQRIFFSAAVQTNVSFHVYKPELYDVDKERRFPVIYWLHGYGEAVKEMPKVVDYFDQAMREGKIPPALVVFPNGLVESMWSNSKDGKVPMETVVVDELVPQVDAILRTIPSRSGRLIEGFSMGGYGAARLGIKYPEIFGAISILGAGPMQLQFNASIGPVRLAPLRVKTLQNVYGNDQAFFSAQSPWMLAEQYANAARGRTTIRIAVGARDDMKDANQDFANHLTRLQVPHTYFLLPDVGHHPLRLFQALGAANWDFYRAALGGQTAHTGDRAVSNQSAQPSDVAPQPIRFAQNREQRQKVANRLRQFDRGDGLIRLIDLPAPVRGRFRYLDTNHDDQIDATELSQFLL